MFVFEIEQVLIQMSGPPIVFRIEDFLIQMSGPPIVFRIEDDFDTNVGAGGPVRPGGAIICIKER